MSVVDLSVYWLGVDYSVVGYCNMVGNCTLVYKRAGFEGECLRGRDWLDEEDSIDNRGQLSSPLISSSFHCRWNGLYSLASSMYSSH